MSVGHAHRYEFDEVEITYNLCPKKRVIFSVVCYVTVYLRETKILHIPWTNDLMKTHKVNIKFVRVMQRY